MPWERWVTWMNKEGEVVGDYMTAAQAFEAKVERVVERGNDFYCASCGEAVDSVSDLVFRHSSIGFGSFAFCSEACEVAWVLGKEGEHLN